MMFHQRDDTLVTDTIAYGFRCNTHGNGEIYNRDSKMLWRFKTHHQNKFQAFSGFFFLLLPDFVFFDASEKELLTIKCERSYPFTRFVMFENDSPICTIQQTSIFQNKYIIEFDGGYKWRFHLPMFTAFYKGISAAGAELHVRVQTHHTWYVQIPCNLDDFRLVAALALIHRERQR